MLKERDDRIIFLEAEGKNNKSEDNSELADRIRDLTD